MDPIIHVNQASSQAYTPQLNDQLITTHTWEMTRACSDKPFTRFLLTIIHL